MLNLRIQAKKLEYQTAINKAEALGIPINLNDIHDSIIGKKDITVNLVRKKFKVWEYIENYIANNQSLAYGTRKNYTTLQRLSLIHI